MKASQESIEKILEAFQGAKHSLKILQGAMNWCEQNAMTDAYDYTTAAQGFNIARLSVENKVNEIANLEQAVRGLIHEWQKEQD